MREHMGVFRGQLIDQDDWVDGSLVLHGEDVMIFAVRDWPYGTGLFHVDPRTVDECTGVSNKNGVLLFENDRILTKHGVREIVFETGCFRAKKPGTDLAADLRPYMKEINFEFEVLGRCEK